MSFSEKIDKSFLTCRFCCQRYRNPKVLKCMHTFCLRCLENYANPGQYLGPRRSQYASSNSSRSLRCPLCRQRTEIPVGGCSRLPDDRIVLRLSNIVDRPSLGAKTAHVICDICRYRGHASLAAYHCIDCAKTLCMRCEVAHSETLVTSRHTLVQPDKIDSLICLKHLDETVRFFCSTCGVCVCLLCTYEEGHKHHDIVTIHEGLRKFQDSMKDDLAECSVKLEKLKNIASNITDCEQSIGDVRDRINTTVIEFIGTVRKSQYHLLKQIQEAYSDDIKLLMEEKSKVTSLITNLNTICTETKNMHHKLPLEVLENREKTVARVNKGRDIEIPKADLEELKKRFYFRRGTVDLGCLFAEPPSVEQMTNSLLNSPVEEKRNFLDIGCQAEEVITHCETRSADVQTVLTFPSTAPTVDSKMCQAGLCECSARDRKGSDLAPPSRVTQSTQTAPRRMSEHVIFNRVSQGTQYSPNDSHKASYFRSTKSLIIKK